MADGEIIQKVSPLITMILDGDTITGMAQDLAGAGVLAGITGMAVIMEDGVSDGDGIVLFMVAGDTVIGVTEVITTDGTTGTETATTEIITTERTTTPTEDEVFEVKARILLDEQTVIMLEAQDLPLIEATITAMLEEAQIQPILQEM